MLPTSLSRNTFRLLPNCENSSFPSALTLTAILPCVILSKVFLNSTTFLSILVPINIVVPINIMVASTITITLTLITFTFIAAISSDAIFLIVSHSEVSSLFNCTFSPFNARMLSSSDFICCMISCSALSFASEF